ncbi:MAG TPA: exonuclease domain-containing protein, partial [Myxococcota bacterium]|nr:exonuclease domain-containing protein [Myxococcota bacterium]
MQLKDAVLVGLDTETTGLDTRRDRVFEIGLVTYRSGDVVENWGRLMDPLVELDQKVVETTGVTTEEVS